MSHHVENKNIYPLFESIRINSSELQNLRYHESRIIFAYSKLFGNLPEIKLEQLIKVPSAYRNGTVKCRLLYGMLKKRFDYILEFAHYKPREIKTLKLVEGKPDYDLKYTDRTEIETLLEKKDKCDDIIIVIDGLITDTSFSNLVFKKKEQWLTPSRPLLRGTARARLIEQNIIQTVEIKTDDLNFYSGFKLINAMLDFESQPLMKMNAIII